MKDYMPIFDSPQMVLTLPLVELPESQEQCIYQYLLLSYSQ